MVLLNEEENREEDAQVLMDGGLRCHVSFPKVVEETAAMVRDIGRWLERDERAEAGDEQRDERDGDERATDEQGGGPSG